MQDADTVMLNIPCLVYNTGDGRFRPADRGWKRGVGCGSLSPLLPAPDLSLDAPQSVKTLPCLSSQLSVSLVLVCVRQAWCGIMPACIMDLLTNYIE